MRSKPISIASLSAVVGILLTAPLSGGLNVWTSNGPAADRVHTVAIDPEDSRTIYAATERNGIFKSVNGGDSWTAASNGLPASGLSASIFTTSLVVAPGAMPALYAGTAQGVFKSSDRAASWTAVNAGLSDLSVRALAANIAVPSTLYAATDRGVFRTTDAAMTWNFAGLADAIEVTELVADPTNPLFVYAGVYSRGLFKSSDGGTTWSPTSIGGTNVHAVAINPANTAIIYVGTGSGRVFKSSDRGTTWQQVFEVQGQRPVFSLAVDPATPSRIYAGTFSTGIVYRSTDAGLTWGTFNRGLPIVVVQAFAVDPTGTRLYAGTALGIDLSSSGPGVFTYEISSPCAPGPTELCLLGDRFRVTLTATDPRTGASGVGQAIPQGDRHGSFSLPSFTGDATFPEVIVKMLDATGVPPPLGGYFWVFHTGLTDLQYTLAVTDTVTGASKTYQNDRDDPARLCGGADTAAFRN